MMNTPRSVFGHLTSSSGESLIPDAFPRKLFLSHGALSRLPALLSHPDLRLARLLPRSNRPARVSARRSAVVERVPPARAGDSYQKGSTVQLEGIAASIEGMSALVTELESELGVRPRTIDVNLFASPLGEGLPQHLDGYDVIMIQLEGMKHIRVSRRPALPDAIGGPFSPDVRPDASLCAQAIGGVPHTQELLDIDMVPGTLIYMPRGTWHETTALSESVGISFAVRQPVLLDYLTDVLRLMLLQDPRWRAALYADPGTPAAQIELEQRLDELLREIPHVVQKLDGRFLRQLARGWSERLPGFDWQQAWFWRVPNAILRVTEQHTAEGERIIEYGDSAVLPDGRSLQAAVAADLIAPCAWIGACASTFTAAQLRDEFKQVTPQNLYELLNVLVTAGVLVYLWFPIVKPEKS